MQKLRFKFSDFKRYIIIKKSNVFLISQNSNKIMQYLNKNQEYRNSLIWSLLLLFSSKIKLILFFIA